MGRAADRRLDGTIYVYKATERYGRHAKLGQLSCDMPRALEAQRAVRHTCHEVCCTEMASCAIRATYRSS
eukprot:2414875-Rhodomonas_salina.5